jgi:hypothetical protein
VHAARVHGRNDLGLGLIVQALSHRPYWKDTVISVVEANAQAGATTPIRTPGADITLQHRF